MDTEPNKATEEPFIKIEVLKRKDTIAIKINGIPQLSINTEQQEIFNLSFKTIPGKLNSLKDAELTVPLTSSFFNIKSTKSVEFLEDDSKETESES